MLHLYRMGDTNETGRRAEAPPHVHSLEALGDGGEGAEARTVFASASGEEREKGWQARAGWTEGRGGGENFFLARLSLIFSLFWWCAGPTMTS